MRRSILQRATAGLLAGIFLLAGSADVYGLHRCPHHGHHGGSDAPAQAAEVPAPDVVHFTSGPADDERPTGGPCTCVGSCHGSASTPVVAAAPAGPASDLLRADLRLAAAAHDAPAADPTAFLVPYPNGPPPTG